MTRKRGGPKIVMGNDDLRETSYYSYTTDAVEGSDVARYPAFRSFPASVSNFSSLTVCRDTGCRVTQAMDYIEAAYLCPRAEYEWFEANGMSLSQAGST
ncbi:hypothetical protein BP5796_12453 [Coleophoma crateriformis]|uniref:Uncharacterized protein n=1 Tax=Coleophoma crateriformis TaxID=565419 RepID=A0A3D8Q742_9HELO|nr:hypothetical protein BP5796_12453 [Coleophoma crateriformis]